jgi:hypothetical protein
MQGEAGFDRLACGRDGEAAEGGAAKFTRHLL